MTGTSRIYNERLEIEFLIGQMGAGRDSVIKTRIGVKADALRHLSILSDHSIPIRLNGYQVWVPLPEAYAVHKMIINPERGRKREKDLQAIENILPFLNAERTKIVLSRLGKKETSRVRSFFSLHENLKSDIFDI